MIAHIPFRCHIRVFDQCINELTVFVWELAPLDRRKRSGREWIEEHIKENYADLFSRLGIQGYGGWEAVFTATMFSDYCGPDQEVDEGIALGDWKAQQLPSEMFE